MRINTNPFLTYKEIEEIYNRNIRLMRHEHCKEYDELTMEEKLLVDIDMEYLKDEYDPMYLSSMSKQTLEKCLSRLRKRDRENGKRNGR